MKEKLIELIENAPVWKSASFDEACKQVADHLIANGVTVRAKGRWIFNERWYEWECTLCGGGVGNRHNYPFCPHCGADMRGEEHERN